jgi:3-deoxy-manno-octulosonate cytidylyltransferase (CMP-KDO synthetase)
MISYAILIPARYESTRYPGKPLVELDGVPMIKRVYDVCSSTGIDTFVVTDDERIGKIFNKDDVIYTSPDAENGTERVCLALQDSRLKYYKKFINVQGDMPDVTVDIVSAIVDLLDHGSDVATVYTEMDPELASDSNTVKMIKGTSNAQWFGRGFKYGYWHLGVYGYTREALQYYPALKVTEEEQIEKLEQLRWIKNGWQISVNRVQYNGVEINSPEDVEKWYNKNSQ